MLDFNSPKGYFIHLTKCALKGLTPCEKPEGVAFEEIFEIARKQKVSNLLWDVIMELENKPSSQLLGKWQTDYAVFLNQTALQEIELENLIGIFTSLGYEVLPLKGSLIRKYYPQPDMRTMGDIDFLVKTDMSNQSRLKVREIMHENGYTDDVLDDGQVDAFRKGSQLYAEIHYEFMYKTHSHYEDFIIDWSKMPTTNENPLVHTMTAEDLYYFNIGHFLKNIYNRGIGFRSVMDCYVLWNALNEEEQKSVSSRLENIGVLDFNNALISLGKIWFDDEENDGSLDAFENYLLDTHVYGIVKNASIMNFAKRNANGTKKDRLKFYLSRFFPSAIELYNRFKIKHRIFVLLPFLWAARLVMLPFSSKEKRDKIKTEINNVDSVSQQEIDNLKKVFDEVGLEL